MEVEGEATSKVAKVEEESPTIYFVTPDGGRTEGKLKYAMKMGVFKEIYEDGDTEIYVKYPKATKQHVEKILEFMEQYEKDPFTPVEKPLVSSNLTEILQEWYAKFVDIPLGEELYTFMNCVNYLDIPALIDALAARMAAPMKGKTPDEIRELFGLAPDVPETQGEEISEESEDELSDMD